MNSATSFCITRSQTFDEIARARYPYLAEMLLHIHAYTPEHIDSASKNKIDLAELVSSLMIIFLSWASNETRSRLL